MANGYTQSKAGVQVAALSAGRYYRDSAAGMPEAAAARCLCSPGTRHHAPTHKAAASRADSEAALCATDRATRSSNARAAAQRWVSCATSAWPRQVCANTCCSQQRY